MDVKNNFVFDTEDNSKGKIYWINYFDGVRHFSYRDTASALSFLDTIKGKTVIWACNLEYDIANLFGDDFTKVELCFGASRLIMARYNNIYFYDTLNHWKMSVEEMGKWLKFPKLPFDPQNLTYCQRDCEVTYKFVMEMLDTYKDIGLPLKPTIPSSVLAYWRDMTGFKCKRMNKDVLEDLRLAYYGGRTECFYIGKMTGKIQYIDINSMYPFAMLGEYPFPYFYKKVKEGDLSQYGVTYANVKSNLDIPILPYRRADGRLIFPNGSFSGVWTNAELNYFKSRGGVINRIGKGYIFEHTYDAFTDYVNDIYSRRKAARDEFKRLMYKLMLNSLYGKFGQGNERTVIETVAKFSRRAKLPERFQEYNGLMLFKEIAAYPIHTNYIWPSYVTSKSRIILHTLMTDIRREGGDILYCDTDSVIFKGETEGIHISNDLGGYKLEGTFDFIDMRTCKMYKLKLGEDDYIRCKGVPSKVQKDFFRDKRATYMKPLKIKEAFRRNLKPNLWLEHKKVFIETYGKGNITKSGYIKPFIL